MNCLAETIQRAFRWGVSQEMLPEAVYRALTTVMGLRKGRTEARETRPVRPVADEVVDVALPYLPAIVADMVRFQRLTGCRPAESERKRLADRHARRVTPISYGNRPGTNRKRRPKRLPGACYATNTYRRAIHRAVEQINRERTKEAAEKGEKPNRLEKWGPNRLRHSAATEIRRYFGLEAAQTVLGHATADVSQIYAERDLAKTLEVMRKIG